MNLGQYTRSRGPAAPGNGSFLVTKSDTTTYTTDLILALYVTGAGTVCFVGADGVEDTWTVPDNFIIPVAMTMVKSTGTDATGLHGIK